MSRKEVALRLASIADKFHWFSKLCQCDQWWGKMKMIEGQLFQIEVEEYLLDERDAAIALAKFCTGSLALAAPQQVQETPQAEDSQIAIQREKDEKPRIASNGYVAAWIDKLNEDEDLCFQKLCECNQDKHMPAASKREWQKTFELHSQELAKLRTRLRDIQMGLCIDSKAVFSNGFESIASFRADAKTFETLALERLRSQRQLERLHLECLRDLLMHS